MPVQYYIRQDSQNRELARDSSPETLAIIDIIKRTYTALHQQQNLYAIIANFYKQDLSADIIMITEHGMGIMTLHHEDGSLSQKGKVWYIGAKPIPGPPLAGYRNPHEEVQLCAAKIRDKLMNVPPTITPWLLGRYITWQDLIFDTAVCFTNREANIEDFRKRYRQELKSGKNLQGWERFSIITSGETPKWVSTLSFEENIEAIHDVQSYRLSTNQVNRIVTELFKATDWTEINTRISTSKPYAYLLIKENGESTTCFQLDHEKMILGRDASCDLVIPEKFKFVSRVHANVRCSKSGIFIEDRSRNGIFVEGTRIDKPIELKPGQQITLGGDERVEGVCVVELSLTPPAGP
jgi:hypothetical protein